jgi:hypothetical protein
VFGKTLHFYFSERALKALAYDHTQKSLAFPQVIYLIKMDGSKFTIRAVSSDAYQHLGS